LTESRLRVLVPKPPADLEPIERVGRYSSSCRSHRPAWLRGTQAKTPGSRKSRDARCGSRI